MVKLAPVKARPETSFAHPRYVDEPTVELALALALALAAAEVAGFVLFHTERQEGPPHISEELPEQVIGWQVVMFSFEDESRDLPQ